MLSEDVNIIGLRGFWGWVNNNDCKCGQSHSAQPNRQDKTKIKPDFCQGEHGGREAQETKERDSEQGRGTSRSKSMGKSVASTRSEVASDAGVKPLGEFACLHAMDGVGLLDPPELP